MKRDYISKLDSERRLTDRFPIENDLRYELLVAKSSRTGNGRTLNMSSGGMLFTTESRLPPGERVEISVEWPAQLNENCALTLVALGKIVRSQGQTAAIRIERYDFRTRAVVTLAKSA
jgi:hypothetical protein